MRWLGVLAVVGLILYSLWPATVPFPPDKFARLKLGMTQAEVEAVLGCPPGDYRPASWRRKVYSSVVTGSLRTEHGRPLQELEEEEKRALLAWVQAGMPEQLPARINRQRWQGRDFSINVIFDDSGGAVNCSLWYSYPPPLPDYIWQFREWFGR
jgi:hypothetical protein